ncbi:uncharacterized protein LOC142237554 [Haematobia irritans]|uniref:uncharacterized protein LOC142237554 n=1 Tax=Haematobia irritans TaxID=7368 RepID=UPI003F5026D5
MESSSSVQNHKVGDICLDCQEKGFTNRLRYFLINLNEDTLLKCESDICMYPHNDEISSSEDEEEKTIDNFEIEFNFMNTSPSPSQSEGKSCEPSVILSNQRLWPNETGTSTCISNNLTYPNAANANSIKLESNSNDAIKKIPKNSKQNKKSPTKINVVDDKSKTNIKTPSIKKQEENKQQAHKSASLFKFKSQLSCQPQSKIATTKSDKDMLLPTSSTKAESSKDVEFSSSTESIPKASLFKSKGNVSKFDEIPKASLLKSEGNVSKCDEIPKASLCKTQKNVNVKSRKIKSNAVKKSKK